MCVCWSGSENTKTMLSSTTSTPSVSCSPRWIVYHNMGADGAWRERFATTLQQCLDECVAYSNCVAVEWSDYHQCMIHESRRQRYSKAGVTHFEFVRRCNPKSSTWHHRVFYREFARSIKCCIFLLVPVSRLNAWALLLVATHSCSSRSSRV